MPTIDHLDHLVVAANDLATGRAWVEDRVGAPMEPGGRHETFGTHNALLSLGPRSYLEVIALDPSAPAPTRPRWFGLDTSEVRERLARGPALLHWVIAVPPLDDEPDALELTRGSNRWALTVAADGRMPLGGLAPSRIHWHTPPPPTTLPDRGIRLERLVLRSTDPDAVRAAILAATATATAAATADTTADGAADTETDPSVRVETGDDTLLATLHTPRGRVTLAPE